MEEQARAQYWMLMKRKQDIVKRVSHFQTRSGDSWEDHVAAFMWPPRSYSCSFCKREFRSAQALGGHMNVHRRDRARLKQCHSSGFDHIHTDLSVGLVCKRAKLDHVAPPSPLLQFLVDPCFDSAEKSVGSVGELDLELRLGHHLQK